MTQAIVVTVAVFIVSALLFYQMKQTKQMQNEGFTSSQNPSSAPKPTLAGRKDLNTLISKITYWLESADQKGMSLTTEQKHRQIILRGRIVNLHNQLRTDSITDTLRDILEESRNMDNENTGLHKITPNISSIFNQTANPNKILSSMEMNEFMKLFNEGISSLESLIQPTPLQTIRLKQLRLLRLDLNDNQNTMITIETARNFLRAMLSFEQPLPSLFKTCPSSMVIITPIFANIKQGQSGQGQSGQGQSGQDESGQDESDLFCSRIKEAFPNDAPALGCTKNTPLTRDEKAIVCDRIRYSVPTVSPQQFGCPQ